jgi:hypothetical protein
MFRVNTTRRSNKRTMSPIRPATDVSGVSMFPVAVPTTSAEDASPSTAAAAAPAPAVGTAAGAADLERRLTSFFEAETASVLATKPWLRLERGLRLQKIRAFTDAYPGLSSTERTEMNNFLVKANDTKQLNTKAQIHYENGAIQSIKGLKIIRTGDPSIPAVYKIETTRQTKRNIPAE